MPMGEKTVVEYSLKYSCLVQMYNISAQNTWQELPILLLPLIPAVRLLASLKFSLCPLRTSTHFCDDVDKALDNILKRES